MTGSNDPGTTAILLMSPRLPGARYVPVTVTRVTSSTERGLLAADCANCAGLCCVALAFTRSADFAFDKPAGDPCVNLLDDFRCDIHPDLRDRGFKGCTVFDCLGAGQRGKSRQRACVDERGSGRVLRSLHLCGPYGNSRRDRRPSERCRVLHGIPPLDEISRARSDLFPQVIAAPHGRAICGRILTCLSGGFALRCNAEGR